MLYVDEVNLLHDHLVDLLLDAAAMGAAYVEREGVSVSHAARFLLVGTMNPEEGELRPQLLDRFGLTVEVAATPRPGRAGRGGAPPARRTRPTRRRSPPAGPTPTPSWPTGSVAARGRLAAVLLPDAALRRIAAVCAAFDVDGMRADIVIARAAVALRRLARAADVVTADDVREAARLALPHRRRRDPFDAPGLDEKRLDEALQRARDEHPDDDPPTPAPATAARTVRPRRRAAGRGGPDGGGRGPTPQRRGATRADGRDDHGAGRPAGAATRAPWPDRAGRGPDGGDRPSR